MIIGSDAATAVLLGTILGAGILLVLSAAPGWRVRTLSVRLAPYLRDLTDGDPARATATLSLAPPALRRSREDGALDRRQHASLRRSAALLWVVCGVAIGGLFAVAVAVMGASQPGLLVLPLVGAAGGALAQRAHSAAKDRARVRRVEEELPVLLEFLALCLSAGEGLVDAVRRVSTRGSGPLAEELRRAVVEVGTGESLPEALVAMTRRVDSPALARAVDQLVSAIDRGTPLAEVLHAHASDARSHAQRALIEQAGRKEIVMLVPLVFLILPVSVLFAIFPGIVMLRLA